MEPITDNPEEQPAGCTTPPTKEKWLSFDNPEPALL
jgi:hypothetical protein